MIPSDGGRVGRVHSVESCGAVDGPGLRFVLFLQGCQMRCQYCHNPDTWSLNGGQERTVADLAEEIGRYRPFMQASGGGLTVSGGEPLLQPAFVADLFAACRALGIHTALDTAGYADLAQARPVLAQTDLLMLDVKHLDPGQHKALTGVENERPLALAALASELGVRTWLRYVVVPGWTDQPEAIERLADYVATLPAVEKVELLPYHLLGRHKWEAMGIRYRLGEVEPPPAATLERIRAQLTARGVQVG